MRLTIGLTLLFLIGLWLSNLLFYFSKMDLTSQSVVSYYLGSEAEFKAPRTYQSMLEVTHFHLPMIGMVILLLTHLLIFAPYKNGTKVAFILTTFLSALANETSSWLVRFVSPGFAYLKISSFLIFQGMLLFLIVSLALFLWTSPSQKHKH
ncbi:MAG: hypothetical protein AAB091_03545 [Elusimicrobiota bacterium]